MYSLYPLGFLAAFLLWTVLNYMDRDQVDKSEGKTVVPHE